MRNEILHTRSDSEFKNNFFSIFGTISKLDEKFPESDRNTDKAKNFEKTDEFH